MCNIHANVIEMHMYDRGVVHYMCNTHTQNKLLNCTLYETLKYQVFNVIS